MEHDIQLAKPSEGTHDYNSLPPGTWFCGFGPEDNFPLLRIEGGYASPKNGHVEHDKGHCYFLNKKVWPVQPGSKITIHISQ